MKRSGRRCEEGHSYNEQKCKTHASRSDARHLYHSSSHASLGTSTNAGVTSGVNLCVPVGMQARQELRNCCQKVPVPAGTGRAQPGPRSFDCRRYEYSFDGRCIDLGACWTCPALHTRRARQDREEGPHKNLQLRALPSGLPLGLRQGEMMVVALQSFFVIQK